MPERIVVVCTASICRSPMAAALLADRLWVGGASFDVVSAGVRAVGGPADETARIVLERRGLDISDHESTQLAGATVAEAALVLVMERAHMPAVTELAPRSFSKVFGLTEIVGLGARHGGRRPNESLTNWVARLHDGRNPSEVLRAGPDFDVVDPHGKSRADYERCADELSRLVNKFAALIA